MAKKTSGNLLLSALFIAAFLFFLSVALVVTNREDIRYTLLVDHKLRSSLAAEGMADYSLMLMRTTSNWESRLAGLRREFASGAVASAQVRPYGSLGALELIATGISGGVKTERHVLLEEFRLADSLLVDQRKPHLFADMGGNFQVLTPEMVWEPLAKPGVLFPLSLAAGAEKLHAIQEGAGVEPPTIKDYQKVVTPDGLVIPGEFTNSLTQIPKGHGLTVLILENNQWSWKLLPDVGEQLGKVHNPIIQEDTRPPAVRGDGSTLTWDQLTLDWDVIAKSPSDLTVPYEYFNGPRVEWYAITGTSGGIGDGKYFAHGTHYYYSGFRFKNTEQSNGDIRSQGKDATLFAEPCILRLDLAEGKWTSVLDYLKVDPQGLEEPDIVPGPRPSPQAMVVTPQAECFVLRLGDSQPDWYRVAPGELSLSRLPRQAQLRSIGTEFYYTRPEAGRQVLNSHDIGEHFPARLPALNLGSQYDPKKDFLGELEPALGLGWSTSIATLTGYDKELFALVTLTSTLQGVNPPVSSSQTGLAHFNGQHWQILPAGLAQLLPPKSSYRLPLDLEYGGTAGPMVPAHGLVLGSYASDKQMLRRYVPLTRFGN
ncbi:MAG: hypothetical protein KF760_10245 [Candidatus Eremiobacteraeota bacterium]|nr:hypothetical protein [Candidatus Eremiobacteraeota bacterium]MCW5867688.1 hypothetical protein [Candidatus Eremiobacteraeota bacterium]